MAGRRSDVYRTRTRIIWITLTLINKWIINRLINKWIINRLINNIIKRIKVSNWTRIGNGADLSKCKFDCMVNG